MHSVTSCGVNNPAVGESDPPGSRGARIGITTLWVSLSSVRTLARAPLGPFFCGTEVNVQFSSALVQLSHGWVGAPLHLIFLRWQLVGRGRSASALRAGLGRHTYHRPFFVVPEHVRGTVERLATACRERGLYGELDMLQSAANLGRNGTEEDGSEFGRVSEARGWRYAVDKGAICFPQHPAQVSTV